VPENPTYDDDRMLTRLIREALFHRDSERRHLAALLISSSPFGSSVTDELLVRLGATIYPEWMRARLATLIRSSATTATGSGCSPSSTTRPTTSRPL
jgi:hypothetical protein